MDSSSKKDQALWTSLDLIKSGAQCLESPPHTPHSASETGCEKEDDERIVPFKRAKEGQKPKH